MKKIFVFYGYKGSGKDTCYEILRDKLGASKISFADKLKTVCWDLFKLKIKDPDRIWGAIDKKEEPITNWEISDFIRQTYNFEEQYWTGRRVLQFIGTQVGREMYGSIWVDLTKINIEEENNVLTCITDCRFLNELEMLHNLDPTEYQVILVKVVRGSVDNEYSTHSSEAELKLFKPDYTINNNGTLQDLHHKVLGLSDQIARQEMISRTKKT